MNSSVPTIIADAPNSSAALLLQNVLLSFDKVLSEDFKNELKQSI